MDVGICLLVTLLLLEVVSLISTAQDRSSITVQHLTYLRQVNDSLHDTSGDFVERETTLDHSNEAFTKTTEVMDGVNSTTEINTWLRRPTSFESDLQRSREDSRPQRHPSLERVGRANNRQLKRQEKRKSPFNLIIRLSVGCTGTLVTTRHVLTAAHCVHNGTHLTINQRHFRIEIPSNNGRTSEYFVTEIRLPRKWANNETYSRFRAMYDFSILTLGHRIPSYIHRPRVVIAPADLSSGTKHDVIQFAGFPTGVPRSMWRTVCSFRGARYIHEGNVLHLKRCTASPGYSGAGIFKVSHRNKMQLVGVVSHLLQKKNNNGQTSNYIVASTFTRKKKMLLCSMMGDSNQWSDLCGSASRQRYSHMSSSYVVFNVSQRN